MNHNSATCGPGCGCEMVSKTFTCDHGHSITITERRDAGVWYRFRRTRDYGHSEGPPASFATKQGVTVYSGDGCIECDECVEERHEQVRRARALEEDLARAKQARTRPARYSLICAAHDPEEAERRIAKLQDGKP